MKEWKVKIKNLFNFWVRLRRIILKKFQNLNFSLLCYVGPVAFFREKIPRAKFFNIETVNIFLK